MHNVCRIARLSGSRDVLRQSKQQRTHPPPEKRKAGVGSLWDSSRISGAGAVNNIYKAAEAAVKEEKTM
jgi:hypothetical protein